MTSPGKPPRIPFGPPPSPLPPVSSPQGNGWSLEGHKWPSLRPSPSTSQESTPAKESPTTASTDSSQPSKKSTPTNQGLSPEKEPTPGSSPSQDSSRPGSASSSSSAPEKELKTEKDSLSEKPVEVRSVWAWNLDSELKILAKIIDDYPFVTVDTEFPGDIYPRSRGYLSPEKVYQHIRLNVNFSSLIQVGLTLTDAAGNLPDLGTNRRYIWEFNFKDFHPSRNLHNPGSVKMLRDAGFNFDRHRDSGAESITFAELLMPSGFVLNHDVVWIAFHGDHDFGYLVKILTGRELPETLPEFLKLAEMFFGKVYDVKHMMAQVGLHGGLAKIAKDLGLKRAAGIGHQAGSDSLLTCDLFWQFKKIRYPGDTNLHGMEKFAGNVYGMGKRDSNFS